MGVRAVRGATQLERDERDHLHERVSELVATMMDANDLTADDLISIIFTATEDVNADYPAYAARRMGFADVPLICARELEITDGMPRVVRLMAHVETDKKRDEITHVYLHGAAALRRDLSHVHAVPDEPSQATASDDPTAR